MRVKIGNEWISAEEQPICVQFEDVEIDAIKSHAFKNNKVAAAPSKNESGMSEDDLRNWIYEDGDK